MVVILHAEGALRRFEEAEALAEVRYATADTLGDALAGADALLLWDFFSGALWEAWPQGAPTLRWIHIAAAGVDTLMFDELAASDVVVTNSRGIFDRPIAEFVLASILAFAKDLPRSLRLQSRGEWRHRETERIQDATALVVGTGAIGRETARLLTAVGLNVRGVGRVAREHDPDFGVVHASDDLASAVTDAHYVVLVAPLTAQTRGMVDASVLAAMRPDAHVINVGRGELLVTEDLVQALRDGQIAGAALDVFEEEPLPADHPLWPMDTVLISAHMSGDAAGWRDRLAQMFTASLARYVGGDAPESLPNVVDKQRGYVTHED
nr:D-2-hydroxyacid dehydrogenase [Tomitella biformata]